MKRMKAEFVDLSGDLVCEILCRLDSKTLSKCFRVCKTWFQIMSDPSFAQFRHQFMLTNSKLVVVDRWMWDHQTCSAKAAVSFTMYTDGWMKWASERDSLVASRILPNDEVGHTHFNGLMCDMLLYYDRQTANLLNLRTGELHTLPGYSATTCTSSDRISYNYGYDASKNEYVLVASEWVDEQHIRVGKLSFTIGKTCSGWKAWDAVFPRKARIGLGIVLNNHAYWSLVRNLPCSEGKEIIVSMDLDSSVSSNPFCIIKSPPLIPEIYLCFEDSAIALTDFKGSLGMVDVRHMSYTNTLVLWLLTDRCSSSWIKKFHINLGWIDPGIIVNCPSARFRAIGLKSSKEGELILLPDYRRARSYYILNPETQTAQRLIVPAPRHCFTAVGRCLYHVGAAFL